MSRTTGRNVSHTPDKIGQRNQCDLSRVRNFLLGAQISSWLEGWLSGNVSFSVLHLLLNFCWDPWKGTRVGEASNPGPAASRTTFRKRQERAWDDTPGTHPKDSELAQALLSVLANFQGQQSKDSTVEEPPKKKGKGGVVPKPHGPSLAQSLLQVLQSAIQNQWTENQVVDRVTAKIEKYLATPERTQQNPNRTVSFVDPHEFPTISEVTSNPSADGHNSTKAKGKGFNSALKPNPKQTTAPKNGFSEFREPKGKGKQGSPQNQNPNQIKPKIRFAVKILDREWTGDPIITSIPQIMNALRDEKTVPGNLIFSADPKVVDEVKQIWSAYELRDEMSVAILAPPNSVGPTVSIWWTSDKNKVIPYRYKAQIHQITDFEGPVPKPAQLVQLLNSQGPKLETVRLLTPAHFRSHIAGVDALDTPVSVISEWSKLLGCSVAKLTGGNWQKLAHPKGQLLVGHLRLPETMAEKICGFSGTRGLFATRVTKGLREPVSWLQRGPDKDDAVYFRSAVNDAQKHGVALALRQGGGNDLGLVGIDPSEQRKSRPRSWDVFGTPFHWYETDLITFLQNEGWKNIHIKTKVRRQGQGIWLIEAISPPWQKHDDQEFWQYTNSDNTCHITIALSGPRKRVALPAERIPAPQKKWTNHPTGDEVGPTQVDLTSEDEVTEPPAGNESRDDGKDRSPRRSQETLATRTAKLGKKVSGPRKLSPDAVLASLYPDWVPVDDGGTGDCGFRSIARALAVQQKKEFDTNKIVSESSRLRTLAVGHMVAKKGNFEEFWAQDPMALPIHRDGLPEPETFADYLMSAARRNFWMDGLLMNALAHRLGRVIITFVWKEADGGWQRHVVAPKFIDKYAQGTKDFQPVCLLLSGHHYRALVPKTCDTTIPQGWLRQTPEVARGELRGGGSDSTSDFLDLPDDDGFASPSHTNQFHDGLSLPDSPHSEQLSLPASVQLSLPGTLTETERLSLPASGGTATSRHKTHIFGSCPSGRSTLAPSSLAIKRRLHGKQTVWSLVPDIPLSHGRKVPTWKCPVCGFENFNKFGDKSAAKIRHYRLAHPEIPKHVYAPGKVTLAPEATHLIPDTERAWSCPLCNKGLPSLPVGERMRAIRKHIQDFHPEETPRSLDTKGRFGRKAPATFVEAISKFLLRTRQEQYPSHHLIMVITPRRDHQHRNFWCKDCFSIFNCTTGTAKFDQPCQLRQQEMLSNGFVLARKRYWWNNLCSKFPDAAESFLQQAGLTRQYVEDTLRVGVVTDSTVRWEKN